MNEQEIKRKKIYGIVFSVFRLIMVIFFANQLFSGDFAGNMNTLTLTKLVVLALYVFGLALLPVGKIAIYTELIVISGLMLFLGEKGLVSLVIFPLTTSVVSQTSKIDILLIPAMFTGLILYAVGKDYITIGFSIGLFLFFLVKEYEKLEKSNEIKRLQITSLEREEKNRELEMELLLREKDNENLMDVFIRTKSLNEKIDIDELIEELIEAPKNFFHSECAAIYVLDEDRYRLLKSSGDEQRFEVAKTISIKDGKEPIITSKHLRVPIKLEKKLWGVLDIFGKREEVMNGQKIISNFNEDDYVTIATYTGQVMFSMKHAKLLIEMERMALTDPLTKLANRRHFENQFDYLLKQAKRGNELALIMLDIDHFKSFNDTYGHDKGDEALVIVAEVLQTYLREMDVVGRTGGEEFCVLVPGANDKALEIAERLRKKLSLVPFVKPITISLGVAYYGIDGTSIHELTKSSDKALYWAKEHGRNQVVEYCKVKDGDE
ncbi:sensor domain-containing diguanylate cyclase [Bacillus thuringiensis]|uniref:sensor domain-containing diguanylate cyclase n=1 Tax=Bacillus thuringiensis TaxID=1428 RepID=UPI0021D6594B|nr:GGDEF domain-containing protein [Bacillus thuringiensis]MCU7667047.1 GGDEF domain-containing protein [Bacillus thuringiensis]